nr:PREDICTED: protein FAM198B isoform X1 [Lepisosteus oculatus]
MRFLGFAPPSAEYKEIVLSPSCWMIMGTFLICLGEVKNFIVQWSSCCFRKVLKIISRYSKSKRNFLIASTCFMYVFFLVSRVGRNLPELSDKQHRRSRGNYIQKSGMSRAASTRVRIEDISEDNTASRKPNVVYITLKSKRGKPAVIRSTIRPKTRRKYSITNSHALIDGLNYIRSIIQSEGTRLSNNTRTGHEKQRQSYPHVFKDTIPHEGQRQPIDARYGSLRIYSESAPPWFSKEDIDALRFLADSYVSKIKDISSGSQQRLLLFETSTDTPGKFSGEDKNNTSKCQGRCGLIKRPVDMSEVFAFHLDRILGFNRSLPAVCRRFRLFQDSQPYPVVLWDSTLSPADNEIQSTVRLTWGSYQHSLKQKCWQRGIVPKAEWRCSSIHHYEWSKLALFDFLLQVYNRLDRNCCGFKPRKEDTCFQNGLYLECADQDNNDLMHIIHRRNDPRHLVFVDNKGYFDRDEGNLNFKLLEGIKELPESAITVLKSQRLREKLLQSLFLDKVYWESHGGRRGIEKLIDVIERRVKILLTYANAHGIKVTPMNE